MWQRHRYTALFMMYCTSDNESEKRSHDYRKAASFRTPGAYLPLSRCSSYLRELYGDEKMFGEVRAFKSTVPIIR